MLLAGIGKSIYIPYILQAVGEKKRQREKASEKAMLAHPHSCILIRNQSRLIEVPESKYQGP